MRLVTSICLALATLAVAAGPTEAAPPAGGTTGAPSPQAASQPAAGQPAGGKPGAGKPQAARPAPPSRMGERRRRSYASCNRESHRRDLRGGARRRFLIRCKLGLERRASGTGQPAGSAPPAKRP